MATGGSDPSLPSPGVTINLVTKRGTNQVAGSARALYTGGSQWDYGVEVGGPLWKDRAWIWGAAASNSYLGQTFFLPSGEPVRSQETDKYLNGKLTAQLAPANTLTLAYLGFQRGVDGRDAGPQRSEPTTLDVHWPGASYKVEDSQVLSERLFATLNFSYVAVHRTAIPKGGLDRAGRRGHGLRVEEQLYLEVHRTAAAQRRGDGVRLLRHAERCSTSSSSASATGTPTSSRRRPGRATRSWASPSSSPPRRP